VPIAPSELREATLLIDAMSERFTPARYTDHYREALQSLVQSKIDGNELVQPATVAQQVGAADLVTALRATLAAKQTRDTEPPDRVASARAAEDRAAEESAAAKEAASRTRTPSNC
jgi:DNA end-binding protein Ku